MQIILQQDVPNLGKKGELKDVAPGYARNLLFPKGMAVEATPQRIREWKKRQEKEESLNRQKEEEARDKAEKLKEIELLIEMPAGEGGRLFGSVTPADIAEKLKEKGFSIDKKDIEAEGPIKSVGNHTVMVKLYPGIKGAVSISVQPES